MVRGELGWPDEARAGHDNDAAGWGDVGREGWGCVHSGSILADPALPVLSGSQVVDASCVRVKVGSPAISVLVGEPQFGFPFLEGRPFNVHEEEKRIVARRQLIKLISWEEACPAPAPDESGTGHLFAVKTEIPDDFITTVVYLHCGTEPGGSPCLTVHLLGEEHLRPYGFYGKDARVLFRVMFHLVSREFDPSRIIDFALAFVSFGAQTIRLLLSALGFELTDLQPQSFALVPNRPRYEDKGDQGPEGNDYIADS